MTEWLACEEGLRHMAQQVTAFSASIFLVLNLFPHKTAVSHGSSS